MTNPIVSGPTKINYNLHRLLLQNYSGLLKLWKREKNFPEI